MDTKPTADSRTPDELVAALRRDVRLVAISQFVHLFKPHQQIDFSVQALEQDLSGQRPNTAVPKLLGKLLNTLAGDRNVNSTNWLPALKRAYNRRIKPEFNPFIKTVKVVKPKAESDAPAQVAAESAPAPAEPTADAQQTAAPPAAEAATDAQPLVAETKAEDVSAPADAVAAESTAVDAAAPAEIATEANTVKIVDDVKMEVDVTAAEPALEVTIPVEAETIPKSETAAEAVAEAKAADAEVEYIDEVVDVDWADITFDQKVQAILNICEWHMDEPDRFRRNLKDNDELRWRVQPIGTDSKQNKYFHTLDNRLWIQRTPPEEVVEEDDDDEAEPIADDADARGTKRGRAEAEQDAAPAPHSKKRSRRNEEQWEEIPAELLAQWKEEDLAIAAAHPAEPEEDDEAAPVNGEAEETKAEEADEEFLDERPEWEKRYWAELDRVAALSESEGFVEWEAICVSAQDWQDFPAKFANTRNKNERALRDKIENDILPEVVPALNKEEKQRDLEVREAGRKRSSRVAMLESAADEAARLAREKEEALAKASRASRHAKPESKEDEDALASAAQESRQDRLRKREEEKAARAVAQEAAAMEESRQLARAAAIAANGGVVPEGWETPEELAQKEAERRRDRKPTARQAEAVAAAAEAEALLAAEPAPVDDGEEPWFLACEVCKREEWGYDDGSELICCSACDEWQHLQCHIERDAMQGLKPKDYSSDDFDFVCAPCRRQPGRVPNRGTPVRRVAPPIVAQPIVEVAAARGAKRAAATPPKRAAAAPPLKKAASNSRRPATASSYTNGNGSNSGSATPTSLPGPGQTPLDYESLKKLIASNPVLVNQLPPTYQDHFAQVLGIPVPYPA